MYELFATAQRGKHTIIFIMVLIGIVSIAVRLLVRYIMKASAKSRKSKKA
jgi:flagellar basal body-associated protein FliL